MAMPRAATLLLVLCVIANVACFETPIPVAVDPTSPTIDYSETIASTNRLADVTENATVALGRSTTVLEEQIAEVKIMLNETTHHIERITQMLLDGADDVTTRAGDIATTLVNETLSNEVDDMVDDSVEKIDELVKSSLDQVTQTTNELVDEVFGRLQTGFITPLIISISLMVGAIILGCVVCSCMKYRHSTTKNKGYTRI
jgi:hypothetical protein